MTKNDKILKLLNIQRTLCECIKELNDINLIEFTGSFEKLFILLGYLKGMSREIDDLYISEKGYEENLRLSVNTRNIEDIKAKLQYIKQDNLDPDINEEITDILDLVDELEVK